MNNITKRNDGTGAMQRSQGSGMPFGNLMDGVLNRFFDTGLWNVGDLGQRSVPVNLRETEKGYALELVAPGLRKEDFEVRVDNNTLTVAFQHKEEERAAREKDYLRQEYRMQSFSRSFTLDDSIDAEKISARYENGVLWLDLPRKEGSQPKRRSISIQ
ncbi:Hsp20/alpha crystallin family protein [Flaviaesturariibacter flavus]|nr:Hsp20/alpha crystallin family protein [Flaviaesturariibacter flavus]